MKQIDTTVKRETAYIALFVLILSLLMHSVFLIVGKWNTGVLFGNLLSGAASVCNFFLMGLTVQKALDKEEKQRTNFVKLSQTLRMLFLFAVAAAGLLLPCFNIVAVLLPLFFPRIAIACRPLFNNRVKSEETKEE